MIRLCFIIYLLTGFLVDVPSSNRSKMPAQGLSPIDPSSYSRPELAQVSHVALDLTVDFNKKVLSGKVDLTVDKVEEGTQEIVLDVKDLNIHRILYNNTNELEYTVTDPIEELGSKLTIFLPNYDWTSTILTVVYETSPTASGLQWLTPSQTVGKQHPYLFSQFQAIHARSVIPCQDTPAVKCKYTATIKASKEMTVLMSAILKNTTEEGAFKIFNFVQDVPVPSYLIAIAVGVLESRKIGPRSHVWSEKEIIEECAFEFANTEHQLKTAEEICGPYVWGIYDLLVLPPSFPFGGMENPCLTFVTPTLLAGDRSLANVVAHEIAHSWTGNLVTNKNFEHFWLNEGFTVFVERKIKGRLSSPQDQDFDAYSAVSELRNTINRLGASNQLTKLVVDLKGVHPDDAFSLVPYEKGQTFLRYLENLTGGPDQFEPFLRKYFDTFKYKSIVTDDFKTFFESYFANNATVERIDWNLWLHSPGMPPVIPDYDKSRAETCDNIVQEYLKWDENTDIPISKEQAKELTPDQLIYLLQALVDAESQSVKKLHELDKIFNFTGFKNAEIKFRWLRIGLKSHWPQVTEPVFQWINEVGRMKYVRPLYRDLYAWEAVRARTIDNFKNHRKYMMHVVAYTVAKDLHLDS